MKKKLKTSGRVCDYLVAETCDGREFRLDSKRGKNNHKFDQIFELIRVLVIT